MLNPLYKNMNNRIEWIDTVKYICIMFVMLTHLESCTEELRTFFNPFFLMLFFFCSGYVYKNNRSFKAFILKKIRQLFVPWLVFSCLNIFLAQILSFNKHSDLFEELKWNFLQIRGLNDGLWFIAALFITYIPFYFYVKKYEESKNKYKHIIFVCISLIFSFISILYTKLMPAELLPWGSVNLPWHMEYVFQAMLFMFIGYIFKNKIENKIDLYNTGKNRFILMLVYVIIRYAVYFSGVHFSVIIEIIYSYLSQLFGCLLIIDFSKVIKSNKYFNFVGQNTLLYFALHGKFYSLFQTILKNFDIYNMILKNTIYSSIFAIFLTVILSLVLILPVYIINRYFPFLIGRKKKDN